MFERRTITCNAGVENGAAPLLERMFSRNGLFATVSGAWMGPGMYLLRFLSFLRYDTWVRKYYCYCLRTKKRFSLNSNKFSNSKVSLKQSLRFPPRPDNEPRNTKTPRTHHTPSKLHPPTTLNVLHPHPTQKITLQSLHHKRSHVRSDATPNPLRRPAQRPAGSQSSE